MKIWLRRTTSQRDAMILGAVLANMALLALLVVLHTMGFDVSMKIRQLS